MRRMQAIVARELNIRLIETFCVSSYAGPGAPAELRVLKGVAESISKLGGPGGGTDRHLAQYPRQQ